MSSSTGLSLIAVLILAALHIFASSLYGDTVRRPGWLSLASGLSVAYVFVHLLPELSETQHHWLEHQPHRLLPWLESQIFLAALLGVLLALGTERFTSIYAERSHFWLHIGSSAIYNMLVGGFALRLQGFTAIFLSTIAFGAHFLVNDHDLEAEYGRAYRRHGRWVLATALVLGWIIAAVARPQVILVSIVVGVISGVIILNVLKDEIPEAHKRRFGAFAAGALGYTALLLALEYVKAP